MVQNPVHRVPPKGAQGAFLALDPVHRVPAKNGAQGAPTNPVHRVPLLIRCTGCHYGFAIRCTGCPPRYKPRLKSTLCTGFLGTLCTGFFWGTLCTGPAPCAPEWPKNPVHRVPLLIRCTGCHYGFAIRCTGCPPRYKPRLKSTLCTGFFGGTLCTRPAPCAPEWPSSRPLLQLYS